MTECRLFQAKLDNRMTFFAQHGQSPAGFGYEFNGMDTAYNFEVMMPELAEIYVRNHHPSAVQMAQRFADWFGYVALREPSNVGYVMYTGASSRTENRFYDNVLLASQEPSSDPKNNLWWLDPKKFSAVPISARRIIKVDNFYVALQVKAYHFTPGDSPYLDSMTVEVKISNTDPRNEKPVSR